MTRQTLGARGITRPSLAFLAWVGVAKVCAAAIFLGVIVAAEPGSAPVVVPRPAARPAPKATISFGPKASAGKGGPSAPATAFTVPPAPASAAAPPIAATLRDSLTTDTNADGQPGPGDTLTYTARITAGASTVNGVIDAPLDRNTSMVPGSLRATPVAVDDSYATNKDTALTQPAATGVLANDFTGLGVGTVTAFQTPTPHGGTVAVATAGGFTYTPATGYVGADSFTYTITNDSGSDSATVNLAVRVPALAADDSYGAIKDTALSVPVDVAGNGFQIVCGSSGTRDVADTAVSGGPMTFTTNPNVDFAAGELCTVTGFAAQGTDQDAIDPPDEAPTVELLNLSPGQLGTVSSSRLLIDRTGAGSNWFVDSTPDQDEDFGPPSPATGERIAKADGPAAGKMDLSTALMHEIAHARELMAAPMPVAFSGETIIVTFGRLPAGKSIVITYKATIDAHPITGPGFALSTQGTVSGTNFASIVTDDPDTADVDDATRTAMACPTITIKPADVPQVAFGVALTPVIFTATGGIGTTTLALSGTLPGGVTYTEASATLSGTPTETGSFPFTITATDQNGCTGTKSYTLLVRGRIVTIGADAAPLVRRFRSGDGSPIPGPTASFLASGFTGGVRVAEADMNADGVADIIMAPGPGVPLHVVVFDGATGGVVSDYAVGDPADRSGLFVATGDVDGDGQPDIVTGAGAGDPMVRVFSGASGAPIWSASVFGPTFRSGVRVAAGDVDGDGFADVIAASGFGDPSLVKIFSGASHAELRAFSPYGGFAGGVFVAAGDVNGDGFADVITGAGEGGGPHVRVFDGRTGADGLSFFAVDASFGGGIRVASGDVNGDRRADIITAQGAGGDGIVRIFNGATGAPIVTPTLPSTPVAGALFVSTAVPANRMVVNAPAAGAIVPPAFRVSGWAFEGDGPGVGVDLVDVWAGPVAGGAAIYLGSATLGDLRPDVGAIFGARYAASGYHLDVTGLADGTYDVVAFARSSATGLFNARRLVRVRVLSPGSDVHLTVDVPHAGNVRRTFRIAGSAFDAGALGGGSGVDAVHVWAQRLPGGAVTFLGSAVLGDTHPSTGTPIGYHLDVIAMEPGDYVLVVFAKSAARPDFTAAQTVIVTVGASAPSLEMSIDIPAPGPVPAGGLAVAGWALALDGATIPGVDAVHVWAFPVAGGAPVFVGAATLGFFRPDVGALFGPGYENSGFSLSGATLPSGTWDLVVFARATGADAFGITRTVRITVP